MLQKYLTNINKEIDKDGWKLWVDIKKKIRPKWKKWFRNESEIVTKLEFQKCTLMIDKNLFYDLSRTFPQGHHFDELVFDDSGKITLLEGSLNTIGSTTVIFRNDKRFFPSYEGQIFNANVSTVILENLHFFIVWVKRNLIIGFI